MSKAIVSKGHPSALNCIAWSQDGTIAFAASGRVTILTPKLKPSLYSHGYDAAFKDSHWESFDIVVNLFTEDESPMVTPAAFRDYSIGEEITTSEIIALSWSPQGLAQNRRCALTVLTSNLVLSIWEAQGDPSRHKNWKRVLVINHALEKYVPSTQRTENREQVRMETLKRINRRIRAFSWSPPVRIPGKPYPLKREPRDSTSDAQMWWGECFLAVSNDNNEVFIIHVRSPYDILSSPPAEWSATISARFSLDLGTDINDRIIFGTFEEMMAEQRFVSNMAWGPWFDRGNGQLESFLSYTSSDSKIHFRRLKAPLQFAQPSVFVDADGSDLEPEPTVRVRQFQPMKWMPRILNAHGFKISLYAFSQSEILCFLVSLEDLTIKAVSADIEGRWDQVSGIAFGPPDKVHISTFLSTSHASTSCFRLEIGSKATCKLVNSGAEAPDWQSSILEAQALFSAQNNLAANATAKVWGLDASPLGDLIASCFSLHPTDMIEYLIPIEERSYFEIHQVEPDGGEFKLPSLGGLSELQDVSSEYLFFSIRRWISSSAVRMGVYMKHEADSRMKCVLPAVRSMFQLPEAANWPEDRRTSPGPTKRSPPGIPDTSQLVVAHKSDPHLAAQALKRGIFMNEEAFNRRLERLISVVCSVKERDTPADRAIRLHLVQKVLGLQEIFQDLVSKRIILMYRLARDLLQRQSEPAPLQVPDDIDRCTICDSAIKMDSLDMARCSKGHPYSRCALTFMTIQAPGISKSCGICKRLYLTETYHLNRTGAVQQASLGHTHGQSLSMQRAADGASPEAPWFNLARLLYAACDVCIYCGGKFV